MLEQRDRKGEETRPNKPKRRKWKLVLQQKKACRNMHNIDCIIQKLESGVLQHGQVVPQHEELQFSFQKATCRIMRNLCRGMPSQFKLRYFVLMPQHEGLVGSFIIFVILGNL